MAPTGEPQPAVLRPAHLCPASAQPVGLRPVHLRPIGPEPAERQLSVGVLGIFLGMFGAHRFLLGDVRAGVTLLALSLVGGWFTHGLLSFLVAVLVLLEGVLVLTMSADEFRRHRARRSIGRRWF